MALEYNKKSSEIIKHLYGETSSEYSKELSSLSQIYFALGKYEQAIPIQKNAISIYTESERDTSFNYAYAIYTMSLLYKGTNQYHKEIELLREFKKIMGRTPKYHKYLINADNNLAVAHDNLGDYERAISYIKEVLKNTSINDENYSVRLQNLAFYEARLGEFGKAIETYKEALIAAKRTYGVNHSRYAQLLDAIGQLYLRKGELNQAKQLFEEAISVFEGIKEFDESHSEYGFYLNNYARTLLELKKFDDAIDLLNKTIEISEKDSINDKVRYIRKKHDLAKVYIRTREYAKAIDLLENFKEEYRLKLGSSNPDYGHYLKTMGKAYMGIFDYRKAIPYLDSSNRILISQIDKVFKFRSEKENKEFVKTIVPEFDEYQSMLIKNEELVGPLVEINLNNQLILKNLLLSQSRRIIDKLINSKDPYIERKVYEYKDIKSIINRNYSLEPSNRLINFDSLNNVLNEKEVELVKLYSKNFADKTSLDDNWELVRKILKEDEIAIEFSNFKFFENNSRRDSILYVAYVYKKNWGKPKIIKLFEEQELKKVLKNKTPNQLYAIRGSKAKGISDLKNVYELVWKPLEEDLTDVSSIYFAPCGILNQIPFSAISLEGKSRLIDKYNLIQLSSTSKISSLQTEFLPSDILFFGGIEYDHNEIGNVLDTTKLNFKELESFKSSKSSIGKAKSWKFLPGTLKEIKNIKQEFDIRNISNKTLKGKNASEKEFKKLDGNGPKIIHIATHGFFFENFQLKSIKSQSLENMSLYYHSEDPLLRSGLILAGGNYAWNHGTNPYEIEDGILTSMEISNLDLSNTDMVVLSACETGLGDIDGSEGVYGLQRAFKMSGVDIIIMSLWEVPDIETAEFMERFYRNWLGGIEVRRAFNQTQRFMANKYKGEPEKWAAFVLFE